ncbi:TonB-dependent receptor [Asticcacaulis sp. AC466]|uniref:TonB-dependent receptor n=1 Tax=Asticcacaulis sp. AC466 TaxID=1282362 RepID=UPI0004287EEB
MTMPTTGRRGLKKALLCATILMSGATGAAWAQDAATAAPAASPDGAATEVIVTGFKKSYADAVRSKRTNIEITDGISSDGLGRFPDLNVGEALQRVPGVQINREAEGRNATINLRGMPGSYARTTLNGQAFADPPSLSDDSSGPLGAFNSDIFSAFMIEKSPMANAQSGGLSGNIDMQIAPALSRKDGGFAKASYEYNTLGDLSSPAFTLGYNKHISPTLAVFGTIAYKHENFRRDTLRFNTYSVLDATNTGMSAANFASKYGAFYSPTACTSSGTAFCQSLSSALGLTDAQAAPYINSATGSKGTAGAWYDSALRQYTRMNVGNLWTGSAGVEWKPNDNTKLGVVGFYTDRNLPKTTQYFLINSMWDGAGTVATNGDPVATSDGRYLYPNISMTNFPAKSSTRLYSQHQQSKGLVANADWHNDKWRAAAVLSISNGMSSSLETEIDLQTNPASTGTNGITANFNTGLGKLGDFAYNVTPSPQNAIFNYPFYDASASTGGCQTSPTYVTNSWNWTSCDPENLYTADGVYNLNASGSESYAYNQVNSAQFDLERYIDFGPITSIQGGVRLEQNRFKSRGFRNMAYGLNTTKITQDMLIAAPSINDFMGGNAAISKNWQVIDVEKFLGAVTPVNLYNNGGLSSVGLNILYADGAFANYNYTNSNDLTEAYIQAKYDTQLIGHRVRGNFGVRYESTDNKIQTLDQTSAFADGVGALSNYSQHEIDNKYHYWLPSAIFAADIRDDLVLRGAYYKTYVRPQARQYSPVSIFGQPMLDGSTSTPSMQVYNASVTIGNNKLHPYLADSYDLSLEWYNRPNSLMSIAYFDKKITGRIAGTSDPAILCPSDGSNWGYGALTWNGTNCIATSLGSSTKTVYVNASGSYNLDKPTYVHGLEFNIQQNLDFLPGFWKNFGGNFNYAFTQAKSPSLAPFPGISKYTYNYIGYYETTKWGIRATYNWRSDYPLNANGTYSGGARSVQARGQLDMSASYNINDQVTIAFDAYNMTNSKRFEYENDTKLVRWIDYDGSTYTVTVKATF